MSIPQESFHACSISMVKNEADIIESFVRFHTSFLGTMVILDNGSSDNTPIILQKLLAEGLPIDIISFDNGYNQCAIMNELMHYAVKKHAPDSIIPLDADEFLHCDSNPAYTLKKLGSNHVFSYLWRTYVVTPQDDPAEHFIPAKMQHRRDPQYETFRKVIIPAPLVHKYSLQLSRGNHFVTGDSSLSVRNVDVLALAHYPIRSLEQYYAKTLMGGLRLMSRYEENPYASLHRKMAYEALKKGEPIDITQKSLNYANFSEIPFTSLKRSKLNYTFCNDLEMRYTELAQTNAWNSLLLLAEQMAHELQELRMKNPAGATASCGLIDSLPGTLQP